MSKQTPSFEEWLKTPIVGDTKIRDTLSEREIGVAKKAWSARDELAKEEVIRTRRNAVGIIKRIHARYMGSIRANRLARERLKSVNLKLDEFGGHLLLIGAPTSVLEDFRSTRKEIEALLRVEV